MRKLIQMILVFALAFAAAAPSYADDASSTSSTSNLTGTRKQLATIIFAGLGGAVLGLSTLSFYGRPQDYMANIAIGFAVGIIVGTVYVTFKTATNPNELNSSGSSALLPGSTTPNAGLLGADQTSRGFADSFAGARPVSTVQLNWNF